MTIRAPIAIFLALASLFVTGVALADPETNVAGGLTAKGRDLAGRGHSVAVFCAECRPEMGGADISADYGGAIFRFAGGENLEAFGKTPKKYLSQYGGYYAGGVAVSGRIDGDRHLRRIVDGKLYLNLSREVRELWQSDIPGYIKKADRTPSGTATKTQMT